jgi:ATP-dependent RNA helicase DHR2
MGDLKSPLAPLLPFSKALQPRTNLTLLPHSQYRTLSQHRTLAGRIQKMPKAKGKKNKGKKLAQEEGAVSRPIPSPAYELKVKPTSTAETFTLDDVEESLTRSSDLQSMKEVEPPQAERALKEKAPGNERKAHGKKIGKDIEAALSKSKKRARDGSPKAADASESRVEAAMASAKSNKEKTSKDREEDDISDREDNKSKAFVSKPSENGRPKIKFAPIANGVKKSQAFQVKKSQAFDLDDDQPPSNATRPNPAILDRAAKVILEKRKRLPIWSHQADIRWALRKKDILLLVGETGSGKSTQVPQFLMNEPWLARKTVTVTNEDGEESTAKVGGMIAITEPRRVAAVSLAKRVAAETASHLARGQMNGNDKVGYSVRFDTTMPTNAKIKFLTEGMLLQELLHDPYLRKYSAVIVDEIHERSVDVDLLAGFLKNIVTGDKKGRGGIPLKVAIMSATANMESLRKFFSETGSRAGSPSPIDDSDLAVAAVTSIDKEETAIESGEDEDDDLVKVENDSGDRRDSTSSTDSYSSWEGIDSDPPTPRTLFKRALKNSKPEMGEDLVNVYQIAGQTHPVKIFYLPTPVQEYSEAILKTIFQVHIKEPLPGDILVFLTGVDEIESMEKQIERLAPMLKKDLPRIKVITLHGQLSNEQQQAAFNKDGEKNIRRVVLATNIAETSVTVPGVRFVIDCGKAKIKEFRPHLGLQSLLPKPISKSSAIQRKGRAGREWDGKCYRIYTEAEYVSLPDSDLPEILRSDIVDAVLQMKGRGVQDVFTFPLMDPPAPEILEKAMLYLFTIGAIAPSGDLTRIGEQMTLFPLPAAYARVLIAAAHPSADVLEDAIDAIACLTGDDILEQPKSEEARDEVTEARLAITRREGDVITQLTALQKYLAEPGHKLQWCKRHLVSHRNMATALQVRKQLRQLCVANKLLPAKISSDDAAAASSSIFEPITEERAHRLLKCFLTAFIQNTAAIGPDGKYRTTFGKHAVAIHPSSSLYGKRKEGVLYLEHVFTNRNWMKKCSAVQLDWIMETVAAGGMGGAAQGV